MKYIDKPYMKRRLLMIVDDDRGTGNEIIDVFTKRNLPEGITFGLNGFNKNQLYIAHPAQKGLYIPIEKYEAAMFEDKIHELVMLMQALGASTIDIKWLKGEKISKSVASTFNIGGGASFGKAFNASAQYGSQKSNSSASEIANGIEVKISSDSIVRPFVPDFLHWYEFEPTWKQMVQQRMLGLNDYSLTISSKNSLSISNGEASQISAGLKILALKVECNFSETKKLLSENKLETIWQVNARFKPLSDYKNNNQENVCEEKGCEENSTTLKNQTIFQRLWPFKKRH